MRRISTLIFLLLLENASALRATTTTDGSKQSGISSPPSFKLPDSSTTDAYSEASRPTASATRNDEWRSDVMQKLNSLQTKLSEILKCCKNKCSGRNDTVREEICNEKLTTQTTAFRSKTIKMVLPSRKCVFCPCPATSTACSVMPVGHCPCNVQISRLLPCPVTSGAFQVGNQRRKRQMTEITVSMEDKPAIEYLRKLGYVEESSLSTANICHPTNLPATILSPDEKTAAVVPIPMQPFAGVLSAHRPLPVPLLANYVPQQSLFGEISGMQPMNFALMSQQQEKRQRMTPSETVNGQEERKQQQPQEAELC
ncbi:unnamed protein product [Litomosoides sigmodontis]|uniref:Uncharacterized protein n=1 Tax=Litomosoides sigmodontis TaxID=42156 RepID=A0A3P6TSM9_LITSI|nr:unnamed protein product [Litomosoides sigmodontis]